MVDHAAIKLRHAALDPVLDERSRRRFAAAEALAAGRGGVTAVARITGLARSTIGRGLAELRGEAVPAAPERVRRAGGGRRRLSVTDPMLLANLKDLVEPSTRGDPMAPLLWTAKSLRNLAAGLRELGHRICHNVVADLLREMGYSLQANRKTREGTSHPDRDAQFGYINDQVKAALAAGEPAISVDTKYARIGIMHGLELGAWPEPRHHRFFGHECVRWCSSRELFLSIIVTLSLTGHYRQESCHARSHDLKAETKC